MYSVTQDFYSKRQTVQ